MLAWLASAAALPLPPYSSRLLRDMLPTHASWPHLNLHAAMHIHVHILLVMCCAPEDLLKISGAAPRCRRPPSRVVKRPTPMPGLLYRRLQMAAAGRRQHTRQVFRAEASCRPDRPRLLNPATQPQLQLAGSGCTCC